MKLIVHSRDIFGKKTKLLRNDGLVPGVIYGRHMESAESFSVSKIDFLKVYTQAGRSTPIEVSGDGMDHLVLVHDLQLDPVSDTLIHVDLRAVNKDEKVEAEVPVVLEGVSPFEKTGLGRVQLILSSIEVEALPLDLPGEIKIDVSNLTEEGQAIHLSDLDLGDKVEFVDNLTRTVLTTVAFAEEEEEEVVAEGIGGEEGETAGGEEASGE